MKKGKMVHPKNSVSGVFVLFRCSLLSRSFYSPDSSIFRMILFCARRDVDCCALYHGISSSYSTQVFTIFFVYKIGPWANPINDD